MVHDSGFMVHGLGFRVCGLHKVCPGLRVEKFAQGSGLSVEGRGSRVEG